MQTSSSLLKSFKSAQPWYVLLSLQPSLILLSAQSGMRPFKFVLSDLRSQKTPPAAAEMAESDPKAAVSARTAMGAWQLEWFERTLRNAADDPTVETVFWLSGIPWIDDESGVTDDTWSCCPAERERIAKLIHSLESLRGRFVALSGDAHAIQVRLARLRADACVCLSAHVSAGGQRDQQLVSSLEQRFECWLSCVARCGSVAPAVDQRRPLQPRLLERLEPIRLGARWVRFNKCLVRGI